ncbi:MAG: cation transporter [Phycisphaerae bacterium]|nr:cation transporter [Phycisphaerae bacterium]
MHSSTPLAGRAEHYAGQVRRVTVIGLLVNLILSGLKLLAGLIGSSQAVVADAVHSLSDSVTDVAILIGVRYWSKPPDDEHPHGHRRIETLVTTLIGVILASVALGLTYNSVVTLRDKHASPPGWIAFAAALLSIASKEILYRWTVRVGRRIKSTAVIANAWHHRSDALSSIPAAIAVAGAALLPGWSFLDHVGAVVVSFFILQAAWKIMMPALGQLIDAGASEDDLKRIRALAMSVDGVRHVHAIRTRYIGSGVQVDLHVKVDGNLTVYEGHDISEAVKRRLLDDGPDIVDVVTHLEPYKETDGDDQGQANDAFHKQAHSGHS